MRFTRHIISVQSIVLFILIAFSSETARAWPHFNEDNPACTTPSCGLQDIPTE